MTAQPGIPQGGPSEPNSARGAPEIDATPVGTMLREARLRRGLTITEAAGDTRINPAYLEAIESERWELMPAPVYARGFFRAYARYLGVPRDDVEHVVPRNLPRPRDLEPVAGLRKRGAEAPLSLPSLPSFRLPTLALPRRPRRATQVGDRMAAPAGRAGRTSQAGARSLGSLTARARRAVSGPGEARRSVRSRGAFDTRRGLEALRRINSRTAYIVIGGLVSALVVALVLLRPGGGSEPTDTVGAGGQVAGPPPATSAALPGGPAAAFKEGEMPDLAGLSRKDAENTLSGLGLTFVVIEVSNASAATGTVFGHSPQAGKSVKRGDAVTLLVARAP